jgi:peptidoglycan/LPS O-acetylase OafA/YrhL
MQINDTFSIEKNNFDLIRLLAALQVAITHACSHLEFYSPALEFLAVIPGVPVFFFVSGFLISGSFHNSKMAQKPLANFFLKRVLRLYPALLVVLAGSILSVYLTGYFANETVTVPNFVMWVIAQSTFFQFYNPDFLREYSTGVLNGSLWTISVEIQFYILTPFIFYLYCKSKKIFLALLFLFLLVNFGNSFINEKYSFFEKIFYVSFVPHIYMFLLGVFFWHSRSLVNLVNRIPFPILLATLSIAYLSTKQIGWENSINPIWFMALCAVILKFAFYDNFWFGRLVGKNDISYGVYIIHMPVVNFLVYKQSFGFFGVILAISSTVVLSFLLWFYIEKPFLKLKKHALRSI